jgi:hypothetical protein
VCMCVCVCTCAVVGVIWGAGVEQGGGEKADRGGRGAM